MRERRVLLISWALALVWHAGWAFSVPVPVDWDAAYYFGLAARMAESGPWDAGAVVDRGIWNLALSSSPPFSMGEGGEGALPVDLHWRPLPSRILVPFLFLAGARWWVAQGVSVLLASTMVPLAWGTARGLGGDRYARITAALLAVSAGGLVRHVSAPDSVAVYAAVGGLAWWAAFTGRARWAAVGAGLAVLTRGEGLLLGIAVSLPGRLRGRGRWLPATTALLVAGFWEWRTRSRGGEVLDALRRRLHHARDFGDLVAMERVDALDLGSRIALAWGLLPDLGLRLLFAVGPVILLLVLLAAVRHRARRGVFAAGVYLLGVTALAALAVPATARGTVFRTVAGVFPLLCAVGGGALWGGGSGTSAGSKCRRVSIAAAAALLCSLVLGLGWRRALPGDPALCAALEQAGVPAGDVVAAYDPVGVWARCGQPAVIAPFPVERGYYRELVRRYGVAWVLAAPPGQRAPAGRLGADRADFLAPPWERRTDRVWAWTGEGSGTGGDGPSGPRP